MTLIKCKVQDTTLSTREGLSKAGKPYRIISQDIIVELNGEVRRVPVNIQENASAYAVGNYTIDPTQMITIGRFGFEFNRFQDIKLTPVSPGNVAPMNKMTG